jgi:hypothetical protein
MKRGLILVCGLLAVLAVCILPAGAHVAVNDAFTVIGSPMGNSLRVLRNDIPSPDPSVIDIVVSEQPKHGWAGGLGFMTGDDVGYFPDMFYFGPDSFRYRTYDGHSYSNEATVYLSVVPYYGLERCPDRVWLHTPADTMLSLDTPAFTGCVGPGEPLQYLRLMSEPAQGKLTQKLCSRGGFTGYRGCFDYMPDPGFTGWDSFTVRPYIDSGDYGDCPGFETHVNIYVGPEPAPAPEFPSPLLPAGLITGFIGAVLLIRRNRGR